MLKSFLHLISTLLRVKNNNTVSEQTIKCKIKGLRSDGLKSYLERKKQENVNTGDGSTLVKISGCEYKISEERLKEVLSHWGVFISRIREEVFRDPHDTDGSNRTGIYTVRMNLHQKIPEWLPLNGLRVRIQHAGYLICDTYKSLRASDVLMFPLGGETLTQYDPSGYISLPI